MKILFIILMSVVLCKGYGQKAFDEVHLNYSGELLFHPGIKIGLQKDLQSWEKEKKNGKLKKQSVGIYPSFITYIHAKNHWHASANFHYYYKKTKNDKRSFTYAAGFGVGRRFHLLPVITSESPNSSTFLAGKFILYPSLEFAYSRKFSQLFGLENASIKIGQWNQFQIGLNKGLTHYFGIDLGLIVPLNK